MIAIGWTGKWYADILQTDNQSVALKSGMEKMQLSLFPKEEIRTPKICLLFWKGENRMEGHNQFRQFILAHHSRKINGRFAEYPLSGSFDYGDPAPCGEYNCLTADYAIALVKRYQHFKILPEVFWLDAGWYTGCGWDKEKGEWWQNVGNWSVDKERFPNGLRPIADAAHGVGAKFMVWFEPERVRQGTQLDREHPEWLTKLKGKDDFLFDLGNSEARNWLTDHISNMIRKEGIDYYRQDFNFDPMPYWDSSNKPGRIGIAEIRHIEGLYAYWDSLLVRFPNLLIDNCSSGGRRIDLETTSRSAPLWRTDYQYGEPNGYQCHTFGLNFYLPIHGTAIYKTDSYTFRSGLGGTAVMNWEVTGRDGESIPAMQKRIKDYLGLRPYFYGDYYPLTASRTTIRDNSWLAYQLNRPDKDDGIVLAFRRKDCTDESINIKLMGLGPKTIYTLDFEDYGLQMEKSGSELMNGLDISIPLKPASLLIRYHKK
jgi:alpha-galactosidase